MRATTTTRTIASVWRKVDLRNQPIDFAYWQTQPPTVRLAALETIHREFHGWAVDTRPKIQRACTIIKR